MAVEAIDGRRVEENAGRMLGIVNDGVLAVMASVGHQTGLFDAMAALPPATSGEVADAAGLDERYVREWLGAMVVGRIVEYEPEGERYRLPPEWAALLTRAAGPGNLALVARLAALCGLMEPAIIERMRDGAGLPYSAYPGFHEVQAELTAGTFDAGLVDVIIPLAPGLTERLREGIDVLEIGCGAGRAANLLAAAFPASRVTGLDLSGEAVALAREEAERTGSGAAFRVGDVAGLDAEAEYDLVTAFEVVHDLPHPGATLAAVRRALRPGGTLLMGDIAAASRLEDNLDHPLGPTLYGGSLMHCVPVSLGQGGEALGTVWGVERARELLAAAGFGAVDVTRLAGDPVNAYYVARSA